MAIKITKPAKQVKSNMQRAISNIAGDTTERGLTIVAIEITKFAAELTPVDTSNLINSQYRSVDKTSDGWRAGIGYTAGYAEYVHDGGPKNWQKPGAEDEFLSKAVDRNSAYLIKILKDNYRG